MSKVLERVPVYEAVQNVMLDNIENEVWKANERIPGENELADTYGVSRNSVRTAIKILSSDNILVCRPGIGTYVTEEAKSEILNHKLLKVMQDGKNALEITEVRAILDVAIARMAAEKCTDEDVRILEQCIENDEKAAQNEDVEKMIYWGSKFHWHMAEMTGNCVLATIYKSLKNQFDTNRLWYIENRKPEQVYEENEVSDRHILEALKAHDAELAAKLMSEHVGIRKHGVTEIVNGLSGL